MNKRDKLNTLLLFTTKPFGSLYKTYSEITNSEVETYLNDYEFDVIDWEIVLSYFSLSEEFIEKHIDLLYIPLVYKTQIFSEEFIRKHIDIMNFKYISYLCPLSEELIELLINHYNHLLSFESYDRYPFDNISEYQKLSESFMEKHSNLINWTQISRYQRLNEEFIERNANKVNWEYISKYQLLSEKFIEENKDKIYWNNISNYQKLTNEFIKKYKLSIPKDTWMYKDKEYKRKQILKTGLYEIEGDYLTAYKAVRKNNYSVFNYIYQYKIGEDYESHADYNLEHENSFGLSAWTLAGALSYYRKGKLLKVKIHLNDVACLIQNGYKLRCTKIHIVDEISFF